MAFNLNIDNYVKDPAITTNIVAVPKIYLQAICGLSSKGSCKHITHFVIGREQGKSRHWRVVIGREAMTSL